MSLTAEEFWQLSYEGLLEDVRRAELIGSLVYEQPWHGKGHWEVFCALQGSVLRPRDSEWHLYSTVPVNLSRYDVFEPEMVVVRDGPGIPQASEVGLVIEVAGSSLDIDLGVKLDAYAVSGIAAYWVFDVSDRILHAFDGPGGQGYDRLVRYGREETVRIPYLDTPVDLGEVFSEIDG